MEELSRTGIWPLVRLHRQPALLGAHPPERITEGEARDLTDRVREQARELRSSQTPLHDSWLMLVEVYERRPWEILGYESMAAYLVQEHWFNRTTAGRLADTVGFLVKLEREVDLPRGALQLRVRWPLAETEVERSVWPLEPVLAEGGEAE